MVDDTEIEAAFRFFDPEGKGSITLQDLKKRLQPFYKDMPIAEYKFLMGSSKSITAKELKELLSENDVAGFDPVAEAFKVYDPSNTGYVQPGVLRDIFRRLGFDDLSDEDMHVLVRGPRRQRGHRAGLVARRPCICSPRSFVRSPSHPGLPQASPRRALKQGLLPAAPPPVTAARDRGRGWRRPDLAERFPQHAGLVKARRGPERRG